MKTFTFFLLLLLIATGAFAGMLYAHVAPVTDLASKVPGAGPVLSTLGIVPDTMPGNSELSPTDQVGRITSQRPFHQRLVTLPRHHPRQKPVGLAKYDVPTINTAGSPRKTFSLARLYNNMPPAFVAKMMTHRSDAEAARELSAMDEVKAGRVLADIQPLRAAKITAAMTGESIDSNPSSTKSHRDDSGIAIE